METWDATEDSWISLSNMFWIMVSNMKLTIHIKPLIRAVLLIQIKKYTPLNPSLMFLKETVKL